MIRFLAIATAIVLLGCGSDSVVIEDLYGQWYSRSWTSAGERIGMRAWFDFEDDGTYRAVYQDSREQGTYILKGSKLTTQPEAGEGIVFRINQLAGDTLILNMNRFGEKEELLMVRGKVTEIPPGGSID